MNDAGANWCILRTSGRKTIGLFRSLRAAGVDVWTPIETRTKRKMRSRDRVDQDIAIMPTYIFARADRLDDLFEIAANPTKDHADFSVFHYRDRIPLISETQLNHLRTFEDKLESRRQRLLRQMERRIAEPIPVGDIVKMQEGPFRGLSGIVEESDGRYTLLCFDRVFLKIDTFILRKNQLDTAQPLSGVAA